MCPQFCCFVIKLYCYITPQWTHLSNRHRFNGDMASIRLRENIDEFPRHFDVLLLCKFDGPKIDVVSTYFIQRNFNGWKIDVISTYFVRRNFYWQKVDDALTYFFRHNFHEQKIYVISMYFFRPNFDGQRNGHYFDVFLKQI